MCEGLGDTSLDTLKRGLPGLSERGRARKPVSKDRRDFFMSLLVSLVYKVPHLFIFYQQGMI